MVRFQSLELRLARSHDQGLVGFLLREWLVFCLVGQGQIWFWFQSQRIFLLLTLFNFLALISGLEHISFTGSDFRARVGFFDWPF